jgi:hypothetical protein
MEIQTESQIALNQKCISNRECCISNLSYFFSKGRETEMGNERHNVSGR